MSTLLNKTRMLNKILQKSGTEPVVFDDICTLLSDVLMCNVYIVSRKGKILGHNFSNGFECEVVKDTVLSEGRFPEEYNSKLLNIHDTVANLTNKDVCVFDHEASCENEGKLTTLVPIVGNRERLGTLLLARFETKFTDEDLVLAEYSATIVGLEILRSKQDEIEEEARKKAVVQLAIGTLSYSELEAVEHIFNELDGSEGLLVASKIADKVGITRSVIVNALRKFESAGVIESRSLGMKGTHIKILNEKLIEELKKIK
ncbi:MULTISPECIES: GTP-sensing pleiotropic transcriptional regulator CodY [Clostridium]|uniref:Global transcriptional regulator CodY n=1 Tax=Clostridium cadaveris TaxID=1529 RepID=A0A1I2J885_9CLOT|nr:GTP-sensing pleiotropic transcriptional regulator CodY [Clostridium cadaveris]MDU4953176.1 GTP-sensing pleiotropic transcriptional regulator CodY [Clostridium sp.]MDM8313302.1 GTP-sensing pleiotropic transcriptional regulator CodY [Clostridium cadaveris]MDY4950125.1 GTP-sensing pleiotropic transcriptional regulator CodY [Clostridium cadaveris]NME64139.1 GTP-sensing pleiotropic transcriptional regulator CodY [Clostridium cadaveris]NWK10381.1 GTP-sensing pleiotropic transcriptional regulator 